MKIADIARQYHVSEQAVRNRIQRAGLDVASLRRPGSSDFTEEGEQIVMELMQHKPAAKRKPGKEPKKEQGTASASITVLRSELSEARADLDKAQAVIQAKDETITILREQLRDLNAAFVALAAKPAQLPEPEPVQQAAPEKEGFWQRFRKKRRKKEK